MLHDNGCISDDVILIFDEMILQRSEEFIGGELIGSDENGELFKGIMSFMIIGLKSNVPYIIKAIPEIQVNSDWLKEEIEKTINLLHTSGFKVSLLYFYNFCFNIFIL